MEPQDAWAASKLAAMFGFGNPDDFQGVGPLATMGVAEQQGQKALKERELANRAAAEQARTNAMMYGYDRQADASLEQQQMRGEQELQRQREGTSGVQYGREKLDSQRQTELMKTQQAMQKMQAMMDMKIRLAEINAGSKNTKVPSGQEIPFIIQTFKPYYPEKTHPLVILKEWMEFSNQAQNPMREQLMQRQGGGPRMGAAPQGQPQPNIDPWMYGGL